MSRPFQIAFISLFPEMFDALNYGIPRRAQEKTLLELSFFNPRDYTEDTYKTVDDRPYGGGPGMVLLAEPLAKAIKAAKAQLGTQTPVIFLSPQGHPLTQQRVNQLASGYKSLILLCGRYEGIDERIRQHYVDIEISLGDYVLSGGELPSMALADSIIRLLPGVLGDAESADVDSFQHGLLDHPHYTRPEQFEGKQVPEVLLSGHHEHIARWREQQALGRTWERRPDLIDQFKLTSEQNSLLQDYLQEIQGVSSKSSDNGR